MLITRVAFPNLAGTTGTPSAQPSPIMGPDWVLGTHLPSSFGTLPGALSP
jgi:hypothetical protein